MQNNQTVELRQVKPTSEEISFGQDEIIVSKTDLKGRLEYANDVFCRVAEMSTRDVIGQPHSIIRHPDMPRAVFKLLWDTIAEGNEIFAYVKNMSRTGKYYWVIAHVTPSYSAAGKIDGYHSNRRKPTEAAVRKIEALYSQILAEENRHKNGKDALAAGTNFLLDTLSKADVTYSEFVWSLGDAHV